MDLATPLEETMGALDTAVRRGKALYAGLSNYDPDRTRAAVAILQDLGTPCLIHQPAYNLLRRDPKQGVLDALEAEGDCRTCDWPTDTPEARADPDTLSCSVVLSPLPCRSVNAHTIDAMTVVY